MDSKKIIVTDYLEDNLDWEKNKFKEIGYELEAFQLKHAPQEKLIEAGKDADILIVNMAKIDKGVIDSLRKCKLIVRHGIGYDNVDVEYATKKGIFVANIPDYCVDEVAEQAVMLLMASARRLLQQIESLNLSVEKGSWDFSKVGRIYSIRGKTIGIIGFGRIGSRVYEMLQGFDVKFIISDPYLSDEKKKKYGVEHTPLEELLKNSDFITVHSALTKETYHLLNRENLKLVKESAIIVNTARGGLIDYEALCELLDKGKIHYAALDVYEGEPPKRDNIIFRTKNLLLTPHLSWSSEKSEWNIRYKIVETIEKFVNGELPENILNREAKK